MSLNDRSDRRWADADERADMLARVVARGAKIKRQRSLARVVIGSLAAVVFIGAAAALARDEPNTIVTADSPPTSTQATPTSSPPPEESTSTTAAESVPPSTTTTSARVCRNSTDGACGPFYWDPAPGENQPMVVEVRFEPEAPAAGDEVTFSVTVSDPDARIDRDCKTVVRWGDDGDGNQCMKPASCAAPHGPWTPERVPDRHVFTFKHTYQQQGEFIAAFGFASERYCSNPYHSTAREEITVRVRP